MGLLVSGKSGLVKSDNLTGYKLDLHVESHLTSFDLSNSASAHGLGI